MSGRSEAFFTPDDMDENNMGKEPDEKALGSSLHELLCSGDPSASAKVAGRYLEPVYYGLKRAFPRIRDEHIVQQAAIDAVMNYIKKPESYDPRKSLLYSYLLMSAKGDLLNELKKLRLRAEREIYLEDVQEPESSLEKYLEDEVYEFLGEGFCGFSETDRKALLLMMSGEKSSSEFSKVWGLSDLPEEEQKAQVKRNKDRLRKRLRRWGGKLKPCSKNGKVHGNY